MSSLPARRGSDLVAVAQQTEQIKQLGQTLIASGLLPDSIKKPEAALAVMLKGDEIGVGAMYALSHISIISGKPAMSAELMAALAQRAGHKIRVVESTAERCVVTGVRRDDLTHETRVEFSMDDARRANLAGKGSWKTYPVDLLRSRAISRLCRSAFPDAVAGMSYTMEELGAEVGEDGEVINAQPVPQDNGKPEVEEKEFSAGHQDELNQIADLMGQFPDGYFADPQKIPEYAKQSYEQAVASRKRLERLLAELSQDEVQASEDEEVSEDTEEEITVSEEEVEAAGYQEPLLVEIERRANELYSDRDDTLTGLEWLQRELGQPVDTLDRDKAESLLQKLRDASEKATV